MNRIMLTGAACVLALTVAACGGSDSGGGGNGGGSYAFVSPNTGNAFHISYECGLVRAAKTAGVKLTVQGSNQFSPDAQIPIINAAVAKKPDALITAATDTKALAGPLQQAKADGTKIVLYDTGLDDKSVAASFVASDNVGGGAQVADALAKELGGKGLVLPIDLAPGVQSTNSRAEGFLRRIKKYPGIKVLKTQYDQITATKDASIVQAALTAHPDLAAIVPTYNDAAIASLPALRSAQKLGKVKVFTFDADPRIVKSIRSGDIAAAATQQPYFQASQTLKQAIAAVDGKPVTKNELIPMIMVTRENVDDRQLASKGFYVSKACS